MKTLNKSSHILETLKYSQNKFKDHLRPYLNPLLDIKHKYWWKSTEKNILSYILNNSNYFLEQDQSRKQAVDILISPWYVTQLPWYMLLNALNLRKIGFEVRILFDDIEYGKHDRIQAFISKSINKVLNTININFEIIRVSTLEECDLQISQDELKHLIDKQVIQVMRGEAGFNDFIYGELQKSALIRYKKFGQYVHNINGGNILLMGGGLYGSSGVLAKLAKKNNIHHYTFDSGIGRILMAKNGVAAQFGDISESIAQLTEKEKRVSIAEAWSEFDRRSKNVGSNNYLNDTSAYQLVNMGKSNINKKYDYLILLNISYDTAALSDHQIFKNQTDWLLSTLEILFSKFTNLNIAVRQHPAENIIQYRSRDNYEKLIKNVVLSENQHIHLFKFDSAVSTYDLINKSKVIIVNTSTIGIESAMLGKSVVTENKSYYADSDFIFNCNNIDQYIDKLIEARDSYENLDRKKSENAALYYYMVHCCAIHYTKFTPQDVDMMHILKQNPKTFFELRENSIIFKAIINSNSLASTVHNMRASTRHEQ